MTPFENNPEDADLDQSPEGVSDEGQHDEDDIQDPSPEQADPESGPAADEA